MSKIPTSLYAETTPNPLVMKFVANRMLVDNQIYEFNNRAEASLSPLALELFGFPFVNKVFLSNNFISVTKKENGIEWQDIIVEMREFIRDYLIDGGQIISEKAIAKNTSHSPVKTTTREFSEIEKKIANLLDEYVTPAVAQDGGYIALKKYEKGIVTVSLQGACSGCPSSSMTLKSGIEGLLKREMPDEIQEVIADND